MNLDFLNCHLSLTPWSLESVLVFPGFELVNNLLELPKGEIPLGGD